MVCARYFHKLGVADCATYSHMGASGALVVLGLPEFRCMHRSNVLRRSSQVFMCDSVLFGCLFACVCMHGFCSISVR